MIVMEGLMLVPPERGTIIGKPAWKTRYVVLGTGATLKTQNDLLPSTGATRGPDGRKGSKVTSSKPSLVHVSQQGPTSKALYMTLYKAKGDWEFIAQHPVSAFKSCNIQTLQYRKQSPAMPTLMFEMKSDSLSEKQRRRKSSRTGALSAKDPWANFLLFRTVPAEKHGIYGWQAAVKPLLTPEEPAEERVMTPKSPAFSAFAYPFGRTRRASSATSRISEIDRRSSSVQGHPTFHPHTPVGRERPSAMMSPTPSLRSRRSDLSSQASSQPPHVGSTCSPLPHGPGYNATLPVDMPSPDSMSGYENPLIEGWTSAQGRSSALSSHTRRSNSVASPGAPAASAASTPPGPRETILDRAFQMRCIPGGDRIPEQQEEKISSIARFEALMREADERKMALSLANQGRKDRQERHLEDESEESSSSGELDRGDELELSEDEISIPKPAQRALDYISGRRTPLATPPPPPPNRPRSPAPVSPPGPFWNPQAMFALQGTSSSSSAGLRPRTGSTASVVRPRPARPTSLALPSRSTSSNAVPTLLDREGMNSALRAGTSDPKEKRRSSASVTRLSFSDFAKRLSSTSSLLLVQTMDSSSSGRDGSLRDSSDYGLENSEFHDRTAMRAGVGRDVEAGRDQRCGWRGSVFGADGGFL